MKRTLCIRPLCRADYGRCKELMAQFHALHVQNRPDLFRAASPETLAAYYRDELAEGERLSAVAERGWGSSGGLSGQRQDAGERADDPGGA